MKKLSGIKQKGLKDVKLKFDFVSVLVLQDYSWYYAQESLLATLREKI